MAALADCAQIQLGKMLDKLKRLTGRRLPYLRNANVRWGHIDLSDLLEMPFEEHELERYALRPGDVLVCEGGEPGRAAIWTLKNSHIKFQKALHRVRMHGGISPNWLVQRLYFDSTRGILGSAFTGTTIDHLPLVALKQYRLPIPPLAEQARILAVIEALLSKVDAAVASLERVRATLKRYRASVLKVAVEGRLVPTESELARKEGRDFELASVLLDRILTERRRRWEESEIARMKAAGKPPKDDRWKAKYEEPVSPNTSRLPQLPDGWCWVTPSQIFAWSSGEFLPKSKQRGGRIPVYGGNGINGSHNVALVDKPTLVIGRVGANCGNIHLTDGPAWITDNAIFGFAAASEINLPYWRLVLSVQNLNAASGGTGQPYVNQSHLNSLQVPLPPSGEQERIVREVERLNSIATAASQAGDRNIALSQRLRQSVLKWAFEGKLADQDPNDEPASVLLERIRAERGATTPAAKSRKSSIHEVEAAK